MKVSLPTGEFPGPVVAWLGPPTVTEPVLAFGTRFLHSGLLRDAEFHNSVRQCFSSDISRGSSCYFSEGNRCIVTLGFSTDLVANEEVPDILGRLWLERVPACAERARLALEDWLERQFQYHQVGKPYGIRFLTRVRESALFGGKIALAARPDQVARRVGQLIDTSAEEVISKLVSGPRVLLALGQGTP